MNVRPLLSWIIVICFLRHGLFVIQQPPTCKFDPTNLLGDEDWLPLLVSSKGKPTKILCERVALAILETHEAWKTSNGQTLQTVYDQKMAPHRGIGHWIPSFEAVKDMKILNDRVCIGTGRHRGRPYLLLENYKGKVLEILGRADEKEIEDLKKPRDVADLVGTNSGFQVVKLAIEKLYPKTRDAHPSTLQKSDAEVVAITQNPQEPHLVEKPSVNRNDNDNDNAFVGIDEDGNKDGLSFRMPNDIIELEEMSVQEDNQHDIVQVDNRKTSMNVWVAFYILLSLSPSTLQTSTTSTMEIPSTMEHPPLNWRRYEISLMFTKIASGNTIIKSKN
jgi:hypothetical protein